MSFAGPTSGPASTNPATYGGSTTNSLTAAAPAPTAAAATGSNSLYSGTATQWGGTQADSGGGPVYSGSDTIHDPTGGGGAETLGGGAGADEALTAAGPYDEGPATPEQTSQTFLNAAATISVEKDAQLKFTEPVTRAGKPFFSELGPDAKFFGAIYGGDGFRGLYDNPTADTEAEIIKTADRFGLKAVNIRKMDGGLAFDVVSNRENVLPDAEIMWKAAEKGFRGPNAVRDIQRAIKEGKRGMAAFPDMEVDGWIGEQTRSQVMKNLFGATDAVDFSSKYGFTKGEKGGVLDEKLASISGRSLVPTPEQRRFIAERTPPAFAGDEPAVLVRGSRSNDEVAKYQAMLAAMGFNPGKIDGTLGPKTEAAIRAYQTMKHAQDPAFKVDGKIGVGLGYQTGPALQRDWASKLAKPHPTIPVVAEPLGPREVGPENVGVLNRPAAPPQGQGPGQGPGMRGEVLPPQGVVTTESFKVDPNVVTLDDGGNIRYASMVAGRPDQDIARYPGMAPTGRAADAVSGGVGTAPAGIGGGREGEVPPGGPPGRESMVAGRPEMTNEERLAADNEVRIARRAIADRNRAADTEARNAAYVLQRAFSTPGYRPMTGGRPAEGATEGTAAAALDQEQVDAAFLLLEQSPPAVRAAILKDASPALLEAVQKRGIVVPLDPPTSQQLAEQQVEAETDIEFVVDENGKLRRATDEDRRRAKQFTDQMEMDPNDQTLPDTVTAPPINDAAAQKGAPQGPTVDVKGGALDVTPAGLQQRTRGAVEASAAEPVTMIDGTPVETTKTPQAIMQAPEADLNASEIAWREERIDAAIEAEFERAKAEAPVKNLTDAQLLKADFSTLTGKQKERRIELNNAAERSRNMLWGINEAARPLGTAPRSNRLLRY